MSHRSSKSKRILSIAYDLSLLRTRQVLLEQAGFEVVSTTDLNHALKSLEARDARFDLVILGHSIPREEKKDLIARIQQCCDIPILALLRPNEPPVDGAGRSVESMDAKLFLEAVGQLIDYT